ncbi:hypothetical protein C8J56DRAFT_919277 [Mycena floridula]|nr:hypothetical protein C8J56DRAFT_919277 [Mycena floridula]
MNNSYFSSHYAQAYSQQLPPVASSSRIYSPSASSVQPSTTWYQPGTHRCSYKGCTFAGSQSSLQLHQMDRHLIFPPGWENQKKNEWDADPALKGKPIPIQGTNLILDDPETLKNWIADRKKRWPTAGRVEDKKRKLEEAAARGQLSAQDMGLFGSKRRRVNNGQPTVPDRRPSFRDRGRGRGATARVPDSGWNNRKAVTSLPARPQAPLKSDSGSGSESDDEAPEVISSKPTAPIVEQPPTAQPIAVKKPPHQPKKPLANPFTSRPSLLRNLLLPEIQMTVSNLSQAIRFLVDNDFLDGVELKPGQAKESLIQVLD